ncbi:hypothetical protein M9Y10_001074 [Tritrichomonas musculus]|uniref:Raptor N-terminal CASPase-like domain-containing protein n=1 Tax=Tritrichomonas musculus TaxID=1915356 RepID=A0ABR2L691_9EUKA
MFGAPMANSLPFNRSRTDMRSQSAVARTKYALAFLCLFDGLRTPSIRRLVRKPRTICMKPLLTFDPSFYAPSSKGALQEIYLKNVNCPCEIAVDPSVQTVLNLLRRHTTSMPPQRVILHYYGHGCHPPMADGCLFFFTEDRARYKPIKIQNIVKACTCPLCIILDCPFAGVLAPHLTSRSDIFAFFACSSCEPLPLSTDEPMDIFSSCLLTPFDTALEWRARQNSSIFEEKKQPPEESLEFLNNLFMSILDSILFDTQTKATFDAFSKDPSINQITRGFVLAQRVMLSFNLHSSALPELKPMAAHHLWEFWDVALDFAITLSQEEAISMVFKLFVLSFKKFPKNGYFPLFSFMIKIPSFHEQVCDVLLNYLDSSEGSADIAARSSIPRTIMSIVKPSSSAMLILAKIFSTGSASQIDAQTFNFTSSANSDVIKYGLLALICAMNNQPMSSFNRLAQVCIDHAADCAPFSAIFLGLSIERSLSFSASNSISQKFLPLLKSSKEISHDSDQTEDDNKDNNYQDQDRNDDDIRASVAFLLGATKDSHFTKVLQELLEDPSSLVRLQAFYGLLNVLYDKPDKETLNLLRDLEEEDSDQMVREAVSNSKHQLDIIEMMLNDPSGSHPKISNDPNPILNILINSVNSPQFVKRLEEKNLFNWK